MQLSRLQKVLVTKTWHIAIITAVYTLIGVIVAELLLFVGFTTSWATGGGILSSHVAMTILGCYVQKEWRRYLIVRDNAPLAAQLARVLMR